MSGGTDSIDGGFWGIVAPISSPVPKLTVTRSGADIVICWPSPSSGFLLEQNSTLDPGGWTTVGTTPSDDGTTKCITISPPTGTHFYRLKH